MPFLHYTRNLLFAILLAALPSASCAQSTTEPAKEAAITVQGDIASTVVLKAADLAQMLRETVSVPDQDGTSVSYEGVSLQEVLKHAGVTFGKDLRGKALASYVVAKAHDGYEVVFSMGELDASFGNQQVIVADKRDGKPLFGYQGPFRLICPKDKAGARSVRMLEEIQIVRLLK